MTDDEVVRKVVLASQPTERFVTVEEIAALVLFPCPPGPASITGAAFPIDGAWLRRWRSPGQRAARGCRLGQQQH